MSNESEFNTSITPSPLSSTVPQKPRKAQLPGLVRIVKAQVTLLASTATSENQAKISLETQYLIKAHGEDIRQHLVRFLLTELYKQDTTEDLAARPQFFLLKDNVGSLSDSEKLEQFTKFGDTLSAFASSPSAARLELDDLFNKLGFDALETFVLASLLLSTAEPPIAEQAERLVSSSLKEATEILSRTQTLPEKLRQWCTNAINKATVSSPSNVASRNSQSFATQAAHANPNEEILQKLTAPSIMTEGDSTDGSENLLSKKMLEAGYECCSSQESLRELLASLNKEIAEEDVAVALGCMARTYTNMSGVGNGTSSESNWNVENFVAVIKDTNPNLNWERVIEHLDYAHFFLYDAKGLEILVRAWKASPKGLEIFPANKFFGKWHNLKGQLSALYQMTNASPDKVSLVACSQRKVVELEDFANSNAHVRAMASQLVNEQLNSLDLIQCVVDLSDTAVAEDVKIFVEMMIGKCPELVFLGFVQVQTLKSNYQKELLGRLLLLYLGGNAGSAFVLTKLWQVNPEFLTKSIFEMYGNDATSLSRILDIAHELKLLSQFLDMQPFFFAIDLAALASRREFLNLEKWLQDKIVEHKDVFVRACLEFLSQKVAAEVSRQETNSPPTTVPLSPEVISIFLKVLSESPMTPENAELLKEAQSVCLQTYPKLMNIRSTSEMASANAEVSFKPDVEEEANSYYERIYSGEMSIDQMIEKLKMFSQSKNPHEQDVFACMIHNLFDEYHFFPKYPEKELSITSILFGLLVQHHLVSYVPLGIALRCVLDALRNPPGSKVFSFGLQALQQFQSRLPEWPQYCAHLLQIPHLQQASPELVRVINAALQSGTQQQTEGMPKDVTSYTSQQMDVPGASTAQSTVEHTPFTSLHAPPLPSSEEEIKYEAPAENVQDKILFIINNIARNNLEDKTQELIKLLDKSAFQWFSNYLVVKRASLEPNYHELYLLLLDAVDSRLLYQHVLRETYLNIQILLNSEKTVTSSTDRGLLKNLGAWLGGMTLARNKPIRHKNIAFKDLLLEGYDSNRLIVVIPFVCKVLEQCSKSIVFKPPNPWLMAILKLLVELYHHAELKLNLKFEIEVLCKSLSIELDDIPATSILKDRQPKQLAGRNALADMLSRGGGAAMLGRSPAANTMLQGASLEAGGIAGVEEPTIALPNIAPYVTFNPQIALFSSQPASKRWVLQAIAQSIREIVDPVVERSVAIATVSTRELVAKDFAVEADENKMRKAAHLMAQNLAGSLAMVTCKEPLRQSMTQNLRNIFLVNGLNDAMVEQAVLITVWDNLDLVCAVIEKAAMEKAAVEVDEVLMNAYASRKQHREQRPGQAYFDMEIFAMSRYPASLPEPLRAKPSGLQGAQLRVYEDFSRIPRSAPQTGVQMADEDPLAQLARTEAALPYGYPGAAAAGPVAGNVGFDSMADQASAHQILERFTQYLAELEKLASQTNVPNYASLPPLHAIRNLVRQVPLLALSSFDKVEAARAFAQKVVSLLYKSETQLAREMYVVLLERLCEVSPNVGTLVMYWLTHVDDERKYNVPVTVALIKAGLINLQEQDQELAVLIDSGRTNAINFAARLIHACIFEENLATHQEFMAALEAMGRLRGKVPESVLILMDELRGHAQAQTKGVQDDEASLRDQLQYLFAEWVRLYQHPSTTEKAQTAFLTQLSQQNVFKVEDMSSLFFRTCIELSVDRVLKFKQLPGQSPSAAYQLIDAFTKLVVGLTKLPADPANANNNAARVNQFSKVLSVIVLIIAQHHEQYRHQFNQRPFLRLFINLLSDLHASEQQLQPIYVPILTALSNTFHTLQPSIFPGFTFAWLQIISHRLFMPKLLLTENQKGWPTFQRLLICLFQFLVPFLRSVELRDTTRMLYRGTLRILLVLLHDFPEFLCDYHYSFCDVIPPSCIQLRNLILSAFPRNMRLPDPFTPNLKVDLLPEINQAPRILSDYVSPMLANNFKQSLDEYLEKRKPSGFLSDLANRLLVDPNQKNAYNAAPSKYNVPLMNSLVFYVGNSGISRGIPVNQGAPMEIYQHLLAELDSEGCYVFLNAIANQLRYPNSHTHYFSCVLLYLFAESETEQIKEQITRVLLERLIVNRPHPWGLLITFIELIKNPRYNFWSHSFTRCATDIERLFESVSRSINQI